MASPPDASGGPTVGRPDVRPSADALTVLTRLWEGGHAAYLVGGGVRDQLLGRPVHDEDIASDALPERVLELFPSGRQRGAFGTVDIEGVQVTTFRRDHTYADHRRPDSVTFTTTVEEDLARRDFTINALAWGTAGTGAAAPGVAEPRLIDPTHGLPDLDARLLRAVGDPDLRFQEDALRLMRGVRLAATLGFAIEAGTLAAMGRRGGDVRWLSAERVGEELRRMLDAPQPSVAIRHLDAMGALAPILPEVTGQHGVPQAKIPGDDLFDHSMRAMDAAASLEGTSPPLVMAGLLHDIGKPATAADGHFIGHPEVGALMAREALVRLRMPATLVDRVARLIHEHMFQFRPAWTDAAVRRFLRRVGLDLVDDLLLLRVADDIGSGIVPGPDLATLRARVDAQRQARPPLSLAELAVDGTDLLREAALPPGPWVGTYLQRLLASVVNDPRRNRREVLLADVRRWLAASDAMRPATDGQATDATPSGFL
ncbi:MAG: HD domain-containing protein [Chloroflexota bacterium]